METKLQKEAFEAYEADAWFDRNCEYLKSCNPNEDEVLKLIKNYNLNPNRLLEVGCSGGFRLNGIKVNYPSCEVYGIEPSEKAIAWGKDNFPNVCFKKGTADNLSDFLDNSMDVVIIGFVFYVIDRSNVLKVVSEIDRILKNNGTLIITDFFSETPLKNNYHHIKDIEAHSYKQNYDEIFTSSKLYYLLDKSTFNHETRKRDASEDYFNKYSVTLLKKDLFASYK